MASKRLIEALAVAAEITGTDMSPGAAKVMVADLSQYPEIQVLKALERCRREVKGRLTLADILGRLEDGRPGPEEAWSMLPRSESATVVWTDEMAEAYGVASPLMDDPVAARVAFLEKYRALVRQARDDRKPVKWTPSLGTDKGARDSVLEDAVQRGRLPPAAAERLGCVMHNPETVKKLAGQMKALTHAQENRG